MHKSSFSLWLLLGLMVNSGGNDFRPIYLLAQDNQVSAAKEPALRIVILEGEGAIIQIRQQVAREATVQVLDEKNKPVAGAMVVFTLPDHGPGGSFADGSKTQIAYTNEGGRATAMGFSSNSIEGSFKLNVTASAHGIAANTVAVSQANAIAATGAAGKTAGPGTAVAKKGVSKTLIAVLVIAGGAAAAGAAVAAKGGGGGSSGRDTSPLPRGVSATLNPPGVPTFGKGMPMP
jgi:hypothetical protein